MWTIERVREELNKLCDADGIARIHVPVRTNGRLTRTLGRVKFYKSTCLPSEIQFAQILLDKGTDNDVMNVIKHEYVHYFLLETTGEDHGHDALFKAKCVEIGCEHTKTTNSLESEEYDSKFKYEVWCMDCRKVIGTYSRMCKTLRNINSCYCRACKGHNLTIMQNW